MNRKKTVLLLLCGLLGCLCFGGGDWLMVYNTDPTASGSLYWLTDGIAAIAPWRNALAMALSFPGILLYGVALLGVSPLICAEKERHIYRLLHFFGLTPQLCLRLFYIMLLHLFARMHGSGYADTVLPARSGAGQRAGGLRRALRFQNDAAECPVPPRLSQRPDEREHADPGFGRLSLGRPAGLQTEG